MTVLVLFFRMGDQEKPSALLLHTIYSLIYKTCIYKSNQTPTQKPKVQLNQIFPQYSLLRTFTHFPLHPDRLGLSKQGSTLNTTYNIVLVVVDREICKKWISRLCNLESFDPIVKKNRNFFFRYMLNVVRRGLDDRPQARFGLPQFDDRVVNLK